MTTMTRQAPAAGPNGVREFWLRRGLSQSQFANLLGVPVEKNSLSAKSTSAFSTKMSSLNGRA